MPKRDFMQLAREIVEQAIGEQMDGKPLPDPNGGKDAAAMERGRKGGLVGGKARRKALSSTERKRIARRAASARWKKR
jgi:hypothetical protein